MEEMRVQIEAREPTDSEIRAFWFTLQYIMGHANITMTLGYYAHGTFN